MIKKITGIYTSLLALLIIGAVPAFAHVIVHPSQVGVAAFQEFTMSVPTEKDNPTIAIKLLIPDGLKMVTPNVKAGWTINMKKNGTGDDAAVTEIDWTGGSIPPGQRDDFYFQAQVPATETTLNWKAYQTYQDGSVVSWDHDPKLSKGPDDDTAPPPYSTTKVVNDLTGSNNGASMTQTTANTNAPLMAEGSRRAQLPLWLSVGAIVLSVVSLGIAVMKK